MPKGWVASSFGAGRRPRIRLSQTKGGRPPIPPEPGTAMSTALGCPLNIPCRDILI